MRGGEKLGVMEVEGNDMDYKSILILGEMVYVKPMCEVFYPG